MDEQESPTQRPPRRSGAHPSRRRVSLALVVIASVLAPIAFLGYWVRSELVDTDSFVSYVTPLIDDPQVQNAVLQQWSGSLTELVDRVVPGVVTPEEITGVLDDIVASDAFKTAWKEALRIAYPQLERVLTGQDDNTLRSSDGRVVLNLGGVADEVKQFLVDAGFDEVAELAPASFELDVQLYHSQDLARVQQVTGFVVRYGLWLVAAWIAFVVAAFVVTANRRRTLLWFAGGSICGASVVGATIAIGRLRYNDVAEKRVPPAIRERVFDVLARPLEVRIRVWFVVAVALLVLALMLSPVRSRAADRLRPDLARPRRWAAAHTAELSVSALVLGAAALAWWHRPTLTVVVVVAAIAAAAAIAAVVGGRWRVLDHSTA